MKNWESFYEHVGQKPADIVVEVVARMPRREAVLDLGAGNCRHANFFKRAGFTHVVAVDPWPQIARFAEPGVEVHTMRMEEYAFEPEAFDIVVAINSLFWLSHEEIRSVIADVRKTLRPRSAFLLSVLGERHDWVLAGRADINYATLNDIAEMFMGWDPLFAPVEDEYDKLGIHWHSRWFLFGKPC